MCTARLRSGAKIHTQTAHDATWHKFGQYVENSFGENEEKFIGIYDYNV